jgi:hypothetical protein
MTEDFIPDSDQTSDPETPHPADTPSEPNRVPLKILVISSPKVVNSTIHNFYRLGYAEVSEWSKRAIRSLETFVRGMSGNSRVTH